MPPLAKRLAGGIALSLLSMGFLLLAFPPYNLWPLVFIAFVPMLGAQYRVLPARFSSLAPAIAIGGWLGFFFQDAFWFGDLDLPLPWWMEALPLFIGLIILFAEAGRRRFHEQTRFRWFVIEGALVWMGSEFIRLHFFGTWGFIAHPLYEQAWLLQPVSLFGLFGLGLLVLAINHSLALIDFHFADRYLKLPDSVHLPKGLCRRCCLITGALTVAWVALSLVQYQQEEEGETLKVAVIQPGTQPYREQGQEAIKAARQEEWETMLRQSAEAAEAGARLIVWPEGAFRGEPVGWRGEALQKLASEHKVYLAVGYGLRTDAGRRNESVLISPDGSISVPYGKAHPVWFLGETSISRGSYPVHETDIGRIGIPICYDLDFTDVSRTFARAGAQILAAPSNDWPGVAHHHYTHTVFRAIENRLPVAKSERAFNSSIVDSKGRILALSADQQAHAAVLVADVRLGGGDSLYVQLGDWVGWLSAAGLLVFLFYSWWVDRKLKAASE